MNRTLKNILLSAPYVHTYARRYVQAIEDRDRTSRELQQSKKQNTQLLAKLAGFDELAAKLARFEQLVATQRLIETEYPYSGCRRTWESVESIKKLGKIISANDEAYRHLARKFADYEKYLVTIPLHEDNRDPAAPHWINTWFPGLDAISLYGLLAIYNPRRYVEVGSGISTKFARRAIRDLALKTKILSIDPCPRAEIDHISDDVLRKPLELVDISLFATLTSDDVVFIDSSHRSFPGSDVTVFFTEILASLPQGILYGIHDIFLPEDYPEDWNPRFFNEQYLLACYLLGGAGGDQIVFPSRHVSQQGELMQALDQVFKHPALHGVANHGGMCWMRKA